MARWFKRRARGVEKPLWEAGVRRIQAAADDRARRLVGQEHLVSQIEAILFEADPIGINFEDNSDEYRPEAQSIAIRLPEAGSATDLQRIIHAEFVEWFDERLAGPVDRYRTIAQQVWRAAYPSELPPGEGTGPT